jgi:hypothetical protein
MFASISLIVDDYFFKFIFEFLKAINPVIPLIKLGSKLQKKNPHFPVIKLTIKKNKGKPIITNIEIF